VLNNSVNKLISSLIDKNKTQQEIDLAVSEFYDAVNASDQESVNQVLPLLAKTFSIDDPVRAGIGGKVCGSLIEAGYDHHTKN